MNYDDGDNEWLDLNKEKHRLHGDVNNVTHSKVASSTPVAVPAPPAPVNHNLQGAVRPAADEVILDLTQGVLESNSSKSNSDGCDPEASSGVAKKILKRIVDNDSSDDENRLPVKSKSSAVSKKKRKIESDSEDDYVLPSGGKVEESDEEDLSFDMLDSEDEAEEKPKKKKAKLQGTQLSQATPAKTVSTQKSVTSTAKKSFPASTPVSKSTPRSIAATTPGADDEAGEGGNYVQSFGTHDHNKLEWIFNDRGRKDKEGRYPDDPEFNPHTLYIPGLYKLNFF